MTHFSEKLEKILSQVLMKHHDDISSQDDDAIGEARDAITELVKKIVPEEKKAGYIDNQEQIKKAIEDVKGIMKEHTVISNNVAMWEGNPCICERCKRLQSLIDLAQQVVEMKKPQKKLIYEHRRVKIGNLYTKKTDSCYNAGYNQALQDFRLWQAKCLMEIEKIISDTVNKGLMDDKDTATIIKDQVLAIRALFGVSEKEE